MAAAYDLGEATSMFRWAVEWNYCNSDTLELNDDLVLPHDWEEEFPGGVKKFHAQIYDTTNRLATLRPDGTALWGEVRRKADSIIEQLECDWLSLGRGNLILTKTRTESLNEFIDTANHVKELLESSPFGVARWVPFEGSIAAVLNQLSSQDRNAFQLGQSLARLRYWLPSSYDTINRQYSAQKQIELQEIIAPKIRRYFTEIKGYFSSLNGVNDWITGSNPIDQAERLHRHVWEVLNTTGACADVHPLTEDRETPSVHGPVALACSLVSDPPPANQAAGSDGSATIIKELASDQPPSSFQRLVPGESVEELMSYKASIDPHDNYIGMSVPILRMFAEIRRLNLTPEQPVVILGPPGAGKTELARLIHISSGRSGQFEETQANQFKKGDQTNNRIKWQGSGKNSGLAGVPADNIKLGLLQVAARGTIFLDEVHSLDDDAAELLRAYMDKKEVGPEVGEGPRYKVDVRFIFATYVPKDDLRKKLPVDVFKRFHGNFLTVPRLNDRKEDIPLFVEHYRQKLKVEDPFLLALLRHDWAEGQVRELKTTLENAVATAKDLKSKELKLSHLPPQKMDRSIHYVQTLIEEEISRELYLFLIESLGQAGFESGARGRGLQSRISEILGYSEATISRRMAASGIELGTDRK